MHLHLSKLHIDGWGMRVWVSLISVHPLGFRYIHLETSQGAMCHVALTNRLMELVLQQYVNVLARKHAHLNT